MSGAIANPGTCQPQHTESRRDFLYLATATVATVGAGLAGWPFIDSMNPAADVRAISSVELDLAPIEVAAGVTYT